MGNHGLQEAGILAAAGTLALEVASVIITSGVGIRGRAYVVLQGIRVVVRIQLEPVISVLIGDVVLEGSYAVLLLEVLHDPQILVVHLLGIHQVEIRETLLTALVLPLPQPVHLVQPVILSQQVCLCPVQQLTLAVHLQHLLVRLLLIWPMGLQEEGRRLSRKRYGCREQW